MAPWGNPEAYIKAKCENGKVYTFTEYAAQNSITGLVKGYINITHNNKWVKVPGLYNPETNEFAADRRAKWAFLILPELAPTVEAIPEDTGKGKSIFNVPLAEDYKIERLGPPTKLTSEQQAALDALDSKYPVPPEFS